jgi:hypothetical protein
VANDDVDMSPKPTPTGADTPPGSGTPIDSPPPPPQAEVIDSPQAVPEPESSI